MTAVSPGSASTPNGDGPGEPSRLPLRWAVIIGMSAATGIACFAAAGIGAAIVAATAVAVALHEILA